MRRISEIEKKLEVLEKDEETFSEANNLAGMDELNQFHSGEIYILKWILNKKEETNGNPSRD